MVQKSIYLLLLPLLIKPLLQQFFPCLYYYLNLFSNLCSYSLLILSGGSTPSKFVLPFASRFEINHFRIF
jgi:hypothetical protein